jgi:TonB-dependent SusC/RagA subfamily outer membrane receptor
MRIRANSKTSNLVRAAALATMLCGCGGSAKDAPPKQPAPRAEGGMGRSLQGEGTASIGKVDGDDLKNVPAKQIEELIQGRVAGVQVIQRAGGGFSILIRGPGSISSSTEPLYVIDGVPVEVPSGRGINWLNPQDIQRIEILKDASATSMYGMRGANGVVVITTRRGKREG